jgi:type IV pilus assembly protein PilW
MKSANRMHSKGEHRKFRAAIRIQSSSGLTLIEFMVSIVLGMVIIFALVLVFANMSRGSSEMAKTNRLIENGRFALQLLQGDVVHAGFWGEMEIPSATNVPDPCPPTPTDGDYLNMIAIPVQAYGKDDVPSNCTRVTPDVADTEVLVVRHANTCNFGEDCDGGADTGPHIQLSSCASDSESFRIRANPSNVDLNLKEKDCSVNSPRRKFVSNIYFVKNYSPYPNKLDKFPLVPTLMRTSLVNGTYTVPQALIEGIERLHVECGVDEKGANGLNISPTNPGDGSAESYYRCTDLTTTDQLSNVVALRLHVLARNLDRTLRHEDTKKYIMGSVTVDMSDSTPPLAREYKRHVFTSTVRLINPSARREKP